MLFERLRVVFVVTYCQVCFWKLAHLSNHLCPPHAFGHEFLKVFPCQGLMPLQSHSPRCLSSKKIHLAFLACADCMCLRLTPARPDVPVESKPRISNQISPGRHTIILDRRLSSLRMLEPSAQIHHSTLALHHSTENQGQTVPLGKRSPSASARSRRTIIECPRDAKRNTPRTIQKVYAPERKVT